MALEEYMEVIRDVDRAEEDEGLVEIMVRSSTTTVDSQGTMRGSVRIRHACHVNTSANFTIL